MRGIVFVLTMLAASPAIADVAAEAKAAVARGLKDPASARFEGVDVRAGAVCGQVNARNGFGGYTGAVPFVYVRSTREAFVLDPAGTAGPNWAARAIAAFEKHCR